MSRNLPGTWPLAEDMGKIMEIKMQMLMNAIVEQHFPRRETVLLNFNKKDSQIARNWRESNHVRDMFDDKN